MLIHRTINCVCMEIMCQSMCKWPQSGNNAFSFLLNDATHRICPWRAYATMEN